MDQHSALQAGAAHANPRRQPERLIVPDQLTAFLAAVDVGDRAFARVGQPQVKTRNPVAFGAMARRFGPKLLLANHRALLARQEGARVSLSHRLLRQLSR